MAQAVKRPEECAAVHMFLSLYQLNCPLSQGLPIEKAVPEGTAKTKGSRKDLILISCFAADAAVPQRKEARNPYALPKRKHCEGWRPGKRDFREHAQTRWRKACSGSHTGAHGKAYRNFPTQPARIPLPRNQGPAILLGNDAGRGCPTPAPFSHGAWRAAPSPSSPSDEKSPKWKTVSSSPTFSFHRPIISRSISSTEAKGRFSYRRMVSSPKWVSARKKTLTAP